jgi:hypothetical protein
VAEKSDAQMCVCVCARRGVLHGAAGGQGTLAGVWGWEGTVLAQRHAVPCALGRTSETQHAVHAWHRMVRDDTMPGARVCMITPPAAWLCQQQQHQQQSMPMRGVSTHEACCQAGRARSETKPWCVTVAV